MEDSQSSSLGNPLAGPAGVSASIRRTSMQPRATHRYRRPLAALGACAVATLLSACGSGIDPSASGTALPSGPTAGAAPTEAGIHDATQVGKGASPRQQRTIIVHASGTSAGGIAPKMAIALQGPGGDSLAIDTPEVDVVVEGDYAFSTNVDIPDGSTISVAFVNDGQAVSAEGVMEDRSLYVDSVQVGALTLLPTNMVLLRDGQQSGVGQRELWWNAQLVHNYYAPSGSAVTADRRLDVMRAGYGVMTGTPVLAFVQRAVGADHGHQAVCPNGGSIEVTSNGQVHPSLKDVAPITADRFAPATLRFNQCADAESVVDGEVKLDAWMMGGTAGTWGSEHQWQLPMQLAVTVTQGADVRQWSGGMSLFQTNRSDKGGDRMINAAVRYQSMGMKPVSTGQTVVVQSGSVTLASLVQALHNWSRSFTVTEPVLLSADDHTFQLNGAVTDTDPQASGSSGSASRTVSNLVLTDSTIWQRAGEYRAAPPAAGDTASLIDLMHMPVQLVIEGVQYPPVVN